MVRMNKFTIKLREALAEAQSNAVAKDNCHLVPVHLTQALLRQEGSSVRSILGQMGADVPLLVDLIILLPSSIDRKIE